MSLEAEELDRRIQAWIEHGADEGEEGAAEFGELAVELFAYQYEHNAVYRRFCRARRVEPGRLTRWSQIPVVPLTAFRESVLVCEPAERAAAVFETSGSTDPGRRGRHHHPHLRLYDASLRANFAHQFVPDRADCT